MISGYLHSKVLSMFTTPDIERLVANMYRRKVHGHQPYRLLLMPQTQVQNFREGYRQLSWLLKEGYFATTIITLNSDTQLENMLDSRGVKTNILEVGKDAICDIVDAL